MCFSFVTSETKLAHCTMVSDSTLGSSAVFHWQELLISQGAHLFGGGCFKPLRSQERSFEKLSLLGT